MAVIIRGDSTFKVKVTGKNKKGKKLSKSLKCTVTVKAPSIKKAADTTIKVGATANVKPAVKPASAKLTYVSSDTAVATVNGSGVVTGITAGTADIKVTATVGTKKLTVTTKVTVEANEAVLSDVKQTASNAFTAMFTADASKAVTKDDIKVAAADGSVELAVKSVDYSTDGNTAAVTVFGNFTNATAYKVTCKDKTVDFTAKVGEVTRIAVDTASAEQNVETPVSFKLFDAEGIDVTPSVSLDTTCQISVSGEYSAANTVKASKASITMDKVGSKAEVTVTYNSNAAGAQDITVTQTITCVDAKAVQGAKLFASTGNTNARSSCAKFYLGLSDASVSVAEGANNPNVYFCAKDTAGDVISYDTYEVESSNDDVVSATLTKDSGKFAQVSITGNTVGSATLNIKATKNGKDTYYTIPVVVTKSAEAASMTVSVDKSTMSNVNDSDYKGHVTAKLLDKDGKEVGGNFTYEMTTSVTSGSGLSVDSSGVYTAAGATAKTYTIKVTGADANTGKTFIRNVNVAVKALPDNTTGLKLTYQIELDRNVVDENPADTSDDSVTAKLYATYNGLFAGYVRKIAGNIEIADGGYVTPSESLEDIKVAAKFGTSVFSATDGLYAASGSGFAPLGTSAGTTFSAVTSGSAITWTPEGSTSLAKTGMYTIEYRLYTSVANDKYTSRTQTVSVKNSVVLPVVTVTSRTADSLTATDIIKCLKTNVDMNNDTSDYDSVTGIAKDKNGAAPTDSNGKMTVKYAQVVDVYSGVTWTFYVPINATFKTE